MAWSLEETVVRNRYLLKHRLCQAIHSTLQKSRFLSATDLQKQCVDENWLFGCRIEYDDLFTLENIKIICEQEKIIAEYFQPVHGEQLLLVRNRKGC